MIKPRIVAIFSLLSFSEATSSEQSFNSVNPRSIDNVCSNLLKKSKDNLSVGTELNNTNSQSFLQKKAKKKSTNFSIRTILGLSDGIQAQSNSGVTNETINISDNTNKSLKSTECLEFTDSNIGSDFSSESSLIRNKGIFWTPEILEKVEKSQNVESSRLCNFKVFPNSGCDEPQNKIEKEIMFRDKSSLSELSIFSDFADLLTRLVFFRKDVFEFIDNYRQDQISNLERNKHSENIKSFIGFIYETLKFLQNSQEVSMNAQCRISLMNKIYYAKRRIASERSKLKNPSILNPKAIQKMIDSKILKLNELLNQKEKTSIKVFSYDHQFYLTQITSPDFDDVKFILHWTIIMEPLLKIINFYNENLEELLNGQLVKFRCPFDHTNRDLLIKHNSYFNNDSFIFIILDWILYFFSTEFTKNNDNGPNDMKILANITGFVFLLFNDTAEIRSMFSIENKIDTLLQRLESFFIDLLPTYYNQPLFEDFKEKAKDFDGETNICTSDLRTKIRRKGRLTFLSPFEKIVKSNLETIYQIGYFISQLGDSKGNK